MRYAPTVFHPPDTDMNSQPARASQTRSFSTIFLIELWERFGYYGMASIFVLFMVEKIGFADTNANLVWGAFTGLVYAAPAIGGWVGDHVLGTRRTMPIGAAILAIGYLLLGIPTDDLTLFYAAMGVIVVGNGLFKANAANMVRRIYDGEHLRASGTRHFPCDRLVIDLEDERARGTFLLDVDGEPLGALPLEVELVPQALTLRV